MSRSFSTACVCAGVDRFVYLQNNWCFENSYCALQIRILPALPLDLDPVPKYIRDMYNLVELRQVGLYIICVH